MIQLSKPILGREEKTNILKVLDSGLLARGKFVDSFERDFAKYIGTKHALSASSGTTALHAALLAIGIKHNDLFITTPFSFIATSNSILVAGGKVTFADIEPSTFNISAEKIEEAVKRSRKRVKGIVITHLYGLPCQMDAIMRIARKYNLFVVEDCAQAHGAKFKGKGVGSFGDIAIFSFYGSKNMTTGEGGMITTNNKKLYSFCQSIMDQGRSSKFIHGQIGFNYRMSNLAAAIGSAQLKKIDAFNRSRIKNAAYLSKGLKDIDWLTIPYVPKGRRHVFHQYTIRVKKNRNGLIEHLKKNDIASAPNYPLPMHKQPAYKKLGYARVSLPQAEKAASEVVNLPVHPGLKTRDLIKIVKAIKSWKR